MRDVVRPSASRQSERCAMTAGGMVLFVALATTLWLCSRNTAIPEDLRVVLWVSANTSIFIAIVPGGCATTWFYLRSFSLAALEESRGYSTGPYNARAVRVIDAKSGLVLREAHDPVLRSRKEVLEALRRARARRNADQLG